MDPAAVEAKYGVTPAQYLDFVALKGDTSDNIPGVPGVGEKTAAKLVQEFGSVEELVANTDRLKGKQKENVEAAVDRLALNKQLARIVTDVPLDVVPDDCVMGSYRPRTGPRLVHVAGVPVAAGSPLRGDGQHEAGRRGRRAGSAPGIGRAGGNRVGRWRGGRRAPHRGWRDPRAPPSPRAARRPPTPTWRSSGALAAPMADPAVAKRTHDAKALERAVTASGGPARRHHVRHADRRPTCWTPGRPTTGSGA